MPGEKKKNRARVISRRVTCRYQTPGEGKMLQVANVAWEQAAPLIVAGLNQRDPHSFSFSFLLCFPSRHLSFASSFARAWKECVSACILLRRDQVNGKGNGVFSFLFFYHLHPSAHLWTSYASERLARPQVASRECCGSEHVDGARVNIAAGRSLVRTDYFL